MTPVVAAAASIPATSATTAMPKDTTDTPPPAPHETGIATRLTRAAGNMALAETMPTGVRLIGGRPLPPDVLRNRLSQEQQAAITTFIAQSRNPASPCRPPSSPPCWPRSRPSGARS